MLAGTCLRCHNSQKSRSGLRVDSRTGLLRGGNRGPAIVPGRPEHSLLLHALRHDGKAKLNMPPGKTLPADVVADFSQWIQRGAPWPANRPIQATATSRHWAFQPVRVCQPPADPSGWSANAIDCFIAAGHRAHGLHPQSPADRRTLLRRVYFDLIGLPPTPDEIDAFVADPAPDAYARLVDRLLASPRYGERWGRHWMDLVRYADTAGDNADYPVPEASLYRDYMIDSLSTPTSLMTSSSREQLAGDILARHGSRKRYAECIVATTYLALSRRYLTAPYEQWHLTLEDTIDTTGRAFLGLTLRCARCHDHKFDPITAARLLRSLWHLREHAVSVWWVRGIRLDEPSPAASGAVTAAGRSRPATGGLSQKADRTAERTLSGWRTVIRWRKDCGRRRR